MRPTTYAQMPKHFVLCDKDHIYSDKSPSSQAMRRNALLLQQPLKFLPRNRPLPGRTYDKKHAIDPQISQHLLPPTWIASSSFPTPHPHPSLPHHRLDIAKPKVYHEKPHLPPYVRPPMHHQIRQGMIPRREGKHTKRPNSRIRPLRMLPIPSFFVFQVLIRTFLLRVFLSRFWRVLRLPFGEGEYIIAGE